MRPLIHWSARHVIAAVCGVAFASGCAQLAVPEAPSPTLADAWQQPLPRTALPLVPAARWWEAWNDPVLARLIGAATAASPSAEAAAARARQARAMLGMAIGGAWPIAQFNASAARGDAGPGTPGAATTLPLSVAASWEIDLWGRARFAREAAGRRLEARELESRALVQTLAADTATLYVNLRVAQALLVGMVADRDSRRETARLVGAKAEAGFEAPAQAALARAALAEAESRVVHQQAEIDRLLQPLAVVTTLPEAELRRLLAPPDTAATEVLLPRPPGLALPALPSELLRQRPDLRVLELELAALAAEVGVAEAERYPTVTLTGSIGYTLTRRMGVSLDGATWGFGPAIVLPIFDAGRRGAAVERARAQHDEVRANYRVLALQAVREVEHALLELRDNAARAALQQQALSGYQSFARAAEARLRAGVGSVLELEEARRAVLAARLATLELERQRLLAWIGLHRATGGGVETAVTASAGSGG